MVFERDVPKVLNEYQALFNCIPGFEYDNLLKMNRHILNISGRDDFKLENWDNFRIIENFCKEIIKLHFFKKFIFHDIFPELDEYNTQEVWLHRLEKRLKKKKGIIRHNLNLVIWNFGHYK